MIYILFLQPPVKCLNCVQILPDTSQKRLENCSKELQTYLKGYTEDFTILCQQKNLLFQITLSEYENENKMWMGTVRCTLPSYSSEFQIDYSMVFHGNLPVHISVAQTRLCFNSQSVQAFLSLFSKNCS